MHYKNVPHGNIFLSSDKNSSYDIWKIIIQHLEICNIGTLCATP